MKDNCTSLSLSVLTPAMNKYILLIYNHFQVKEGVPHIIHPKQLILKSVRHKKGNRVVSLKKVKQT